MLEVRDIRKSFNGFAAVAGVSLDVPAQGITAVIGPNGAGKSTLFNLLTGHLHADGGSVSLEGRDITGAAPHAICRMGVGRSFQHTNIFRKLTVFGNIQAALIAHGGQARNFWGRAEALYRDEAWQILGSLGLTDQADAISRFAVARQSEAARARHRAGEQSEAADAGRADRRNVRRPKRATRSACWSASWRSASSRCSSPSTTWMWSSRSRRRSRCCIRAS